MLSNDDMYEPDEILLDIDSVSSFEPDDELHELSFETDREAAEGLLMLINDVSSPEELFAENM